MSSENTKKLVSVVVMAYNHEKLIAQCLNSILSQQTDFLFEIILGEDDSSDGTRDICIDFANKYPEKISLTLQHRSNVIYMDGNPTGRYNFFNIMNLCQGEFIALCDGDDYWTDNFKLQKQVDFLKSNPEYSGCFHKVKGLVDGVLTEEKEIEKRYQGIKDKDRIEVMDLLKNNNFIHTCSILYRSKNMHFPIEMHKSPVGDLILFVLIAQQGLLKRLDEYMAVYSRGTGSYSSLNSVVMKKKMIKYHVCLLGMVAKEEEREVLLTKVFNHLDEFESFVSKKASFESFNNENILRNKSGRDLLKLLKQKIFSKRLTK